MARLTLPTTARLPSSLRVDSSNAAVTKVLNRLSRASLLSLVLDWLDAKNQSLCQPLLRRASSPDPDDEDNDFYPLASSLEELQEIYRELQAAKGTRREVVDRVLEGDWRRGLSLYQLAMADLQYLYDHPGSLKWSAYRIQRLRTAAHEDTAGEGPERVDREALAVPRFHPSTFLRNLQAEVLPDVKAHYNFDRPPGLALLLLRIFVLDSPYNTGLAVSRSRTAGGAAAAAAAAGAFDASRTIYVAFPDASPHLYVSRSQSNGPTTASENKSLRALVVDGIPKALSRPRERYALRDTKMQTKNLEAMLAVKGAGRTNAAGAGWSVYAETKGKELRNDSPLNATLLPTPPLSEVAEEEEEEEEEGGGMERGSAAAGGRRKRRLDLDPGEEKQEREWKRAKVVAQARFGNAARIDDGKGVEKVDVMIEDAFPADGPLSPDPDREDEQEISPRQKSNKGRRSNVDTSLLRDMEDAEDGDGGESADEEGDGWKPNVRLTFHGSHVFAGIRQLVEAGIIDGERMPGWMTGEEGVTVGAVRRGRIRGHKGSGL